MKRSDKYKESFADEGAPVAASTDRHGDTGSRGKLKIFFGLGPGVGKTFAMLQAARQDSARGVGVVVGCIEPDNYDETLALLKGLEVIPPKKKDGRHDLDLDAIIARHPYLVIVDELAHSNAEGSRHAKRHQDVRELLFAGINVYTTLNIRNLESRCNEAGRIMGVGVGETVPDEMFEITDDVELIDITSTAFLDRLAQGKVHLPEEIRERRNEIFSKENVIVLREMALRLVADRVDKQLKAYVRQLSIDNPVKSGVHLLVLVEASPSSENVLRRAKQLSYTMEADMVALHTETGRGLDEGRRAQLARNLDLARELGARVIVTSGKDRVSAARQVARKENITHIVTDKPFRNGLFACFDPRRNMLGRLSKGNRGVDIYVVNSEAEAVGRRRPAIDPPGRWPLKQYAVVLAAMTLITLVCLPLARATGYHVSFVMFFSVLALSWIFTLRVGPIVFAAALGAVLWGVFFVPPLYTMKVTDREDLIAISFFFFMAMGTSMLVSKVHRNERLAQKREEKTDALFRLTDRLATADTFERIVSIAREEIGRHFDTEARFILRDDTGALIRRGADADPEGFDEREFATAQWALDHSARAGRYTDTLSRSRFTHYPLLGLNIRPGVVAVRTKGRFDSQTELFFNSFLWQVSNAIEHLYYSLRVKNADILFQSDKLYRSLFNSVSHEFRIPVATVMGAADTLLSDDHPEAIRTELLKTILAASSRLSHLVDNLLNVSRLENQKVAARVGWVDVNDLFNSVVDSLKDELEPFRTEIVVPASMPLVRLDFGLIEQALHNLVDNSCKYAPRGTTIGLRAFYDNGNLVIQQSDQGPGFTEGEALLAFDKFYRTGSREGGGLGLGLSIVKGFVEAHGGTVDLHNRKGGGAEFTINIPTEISYTDSLTTLP